MSQAFVINSLHVSQLRDKPFGSGGSAGEYLENYLDRFPDTPRYELVKPGEKGVIKNSTLLETDDTNFGLISSLETVFQSASRIIYLWSDTPFLDHTLTRELLEHHHRYLSQYSFADGWPRGLTPEVLENTAMEKLTLLSRGNLDPIDRDALFTLIQKDINAFDLETLIAPEDFRLLRLILAADTRRNWLLLDRFAAEEMTDGKSIAASLRDKESILRTLPAFYQIQVTPDRIQVPAYLPEPAFVTDGGTGREMSYDDFTVLLDKLAGFSHDAVVSLSYWGEPSCHSHISRMMEAVLAKADFRLLIETSGLGWKQDEVLPIIKSAGTKIDWIVELDALDPVLYRTLRGEGQEEALGFIDFLGLHCPDQLYVQVTRQEANEDHLESLYQTWKEKPGQLIIKKYDHFCGRLPSLKITDLSPVRRYPCWHNKRDMVILADGTVPSCQEMLNDDNNWGNLFKESPEEVWKRGEACYLSHIKGDYPDICAECDEYYTYNF